MGWKLAKIVFLVAVCCVGWPSTVLAQSAIAGLVRDNTGSVLPGVTVEAASPALIEKTKTAVTDSQGQYRIVDLRPGSYTVTFELTGFASVRREGIDLTADFTAPVSVEMRVGAMSETITVSGASPMVDVQTTQARTVLQRDLLDAIPTGRNYSSIGATIPSINQSLTRPDVGGSSVSQQTGLTARGSRGGDFVLQEDGMNIQSALGSGSTSATYHNDDAYQEYAFATGGTAEAETPGVVVNMIPKTGGNQFSFSFVGSYANKNFQMDNISEKLRTRGTGLTVGNSLKQTWDVNGSLGGPVLRDKLWFFSSIRNWAYDQYIANVFYRDGTQGVDDTHVEAYTNRLTWQINSKTKFTALYDHLPKWKGHRGIENGTQAPEAALNSDTPLAYTTQAKVTSTVSNRFLLEGGFSSTYFDYDQTYPPEVRLATCSVAWALCPPGTDYGDIAKNNITTGRSFNASGGPYHDWFDKLNIVTSASYVTGSHNLKLGMQYSWGWVEGRDKEQNGGLIQRYTGTTTLTPNSVQLRNTPVATSLDNDLSLGLYVQDSWTTGRLTIQPGLRYDVMIQSIDVQDAPAGRFAIARHFDRIENVANWKSWSPRLGAAYDLFGNHKTALKFSVGKFMQQDSVSFVGAYNPMVTATDTRTWRDCDAIPGSVPLTCSGASLSTNGDDIAQENELGPTSNLTFGIRSNRNPAPGIDRPYQVIWTGGVQQELTPRVALTVEMYRRSYHNISWTDNIEHTDADYTAFTTPDPRPDHASELLTVYGITDAIKRAQVTQIDDNSTNEETYAGVDVSLSARLPRGITIAGGTSTGRQTRKTCQVDNPNSLRFCDESATGKPFRTTYKFSASGAAPWGIRVGGVFSSTAGADRNMNHTVTQALVPQLPGNVTVQLNEPGTLFMDRVTTLDVNVAKEFLIGGKRISPQFDVFNLFNADPATSEVQTYSTGTTISSAFRTPQLTLPGRSFKIGLQMKF